MAKRDHPYNFWCGCGYCERETIRRSARQTDADSFSRRRPDGTTIYGPKSTEGRPGHYHGHYGDDFHRTPHSTIGSAAIGDAHTYDEHKKKRTKRW